MTAKLLLLTMVCLFSGALPNVAWSQHVVVVCPELFREAVAKWVTHRSAQGMTVSVIPPTKLAAETRAAIRAEFRSLDSDDSKDTRQTGVLSANADRSVHSSISNHSSVVASRKQNLRNQVDGDASVSNESTREEAKKLEGSEGTSQWHDSRRYLLIVGDTPAIGTECDCSAQVPTFYVDSAVTEKWGSTPTIASDFPYADLDNDGVPEVAVGRLPVDRPAQFNAWMTRLLSREIGGDGYEWCSQVQLVGGVGGFGFLADRAIESVARTIVTGVLPNEVQTRVLYGSPGHRFFPKDETFTDAVLRDFSEGCRFWVYAGHGQVTELDRVPQTRDGVPVLDRKSVLRLNCPSDRAPIALLLACYTGAMDASEDSIAEALLFREGGAIAAIAGTRVTMPYGNAAFAVGLIQSIYQERGSRLGDSWLSAQRAMTNEVATPDQSARVLIDGLAAMLTPAGFSLAQERAEHLLLYHLLGDPTMLLNHAEQLEIEVATGFEPNEPIEFSITSPVSGIVSVRVDRPLGAIFEGNPNDTLLVEQEYVIEAGQQVDLEIQHDVGFTGPVVLRGRVASGGRFAVGAAKTIIRQ